MLEFGGGFARAVRSGNGCARFSVILLLLLVIDAMRCSFFFFLLCFGLDRTVHICLVWWLIKSWSLLCDVGVTKLVPLLDVYDRCCLQFFILEFVPLLTMQGDIIIYTEWLRVGQEEQDTPDGSVTPSMLI